MQEKVLQLQEQMTNQIGWVDVMINKIDKNVVQNRETIEQIKQQEIVDVRGEIKSIKNQPWPMMGGQMEENDKTLQFKEY